ncbi:uncharacterized protein LOC144577190 [Callithrix jacchus]
MLYVSCTDIAANSIPSRFPGEGSSSRRGRAERAPQWRRPQARAQTGRNAAQTKGPSQVSGGGEGEPARALPQTEKPGLDRCGRAEEGGGGPAPPWPEASATRAVTFCSNQDPLSEPKAGPQAEGLPQPDPAYARLTFSCSLNSPRSPPPPPQPPQQPLPEILPGRLAARQPPEPSAPGEGEKGSGLDSVR